MRLLFRTKVVNRVFHLAFIDVEFCSSPQPNSLWKPKGFWVLQSEGFMVTRVFFSSFIWFPERSTLSITEWSGCPSSGRPSSFRRSNRFFFWMENRVIFYNTVVLFLYSPILPTLVLVPDFLVLGGHVSSSIAFFITIVTRLLKIRLWRPPWKKAFYQGNKRKIPVYL